ncbi:hypothetical protein TL16_g08348 [Triparma laevis f. inornata]|uniref:Uncharacterized protein n=1 Tax=Triparma laevis f. inornata TaxID=1714386 RepID=A0A9W7B0Q0_9STRA|nr:hypothetical protein TL16_g08348 [Triparma laevis f. inornata]
MSHQRLPPKSLKKQESEVSSLTGTHPELKSYLQSSGLTTSVSLALSKLASKNYLPSNPYSSLVPSLRLEEIKPSLFETPSAEAHWLKSLLDGSIYGTYNVNSRRTSRKTTAPTPTQHIISVPLAPLHEGSIYGFKHIIEVLDVVGVIGVLKGCKILDQAMYPSGMKLMKGKDYNESLSVSIVPPTTFHGSAFSSGELVDLIQNVDVTIQGSQFEKAVNFYSRRLMTELFALEQANNVCLDIKLHCKTASRKKGDPDTVKTFLPNSVRHHKNNFISAVKSSTVSHRSVTLECLMRTPYFKSDPTMPKTEVQVGNPVVSWKFIRLKRNYIMHYKDSNGTSRSFAELPGLNLAVGYFLDPGGAEAAEKYLSLFSSTQLTATGARKKKVNKFVVEKMGKKENDSEAQRVAQEAIIGGGPGSTIWDYPLFDPIVDSLKEGVKEAVTRRNDFNAFGFCLPICLLTGKKEALRDMWRMLGGAKLTEDSKETSRCGLAAYMNRLRNDSQVLADCCRNANEIMLALVKAEKEFWAGNSDDVSKKTAHKAHVEKVLQNVKEIVTVINSMFWSWNVEILELAAAGAGSDAAGLNDVFYALLNDIGDVTERRMKISEFPTYEADDAPTTPSPNRVARKLYDDSDSDSDDSDSDSDDEDHHNKENNNTTQTPTKSGPLIMPKLDEAQTKAYAESLRRNMKVLKVLTGLVIGLERCAGMDVASLCVEHHMSMVQGRLQKMREGEGMVKKSKKFLYAVDIEGANFFQKMQALNVVTGIGMLESVLSGPTINDITPGHTTNKPANSAKVAPGGTDTDKENTEQQNELLFSIRWTFDRQKMRELDPVLHAKVINVEREAMLAAKSRNMYAAPIVKEGVVTQYLVDSRVDQALSGCFDYVLGGALVTNPFPRFVSRLRSYAKRLDWDKDDDEVLEEVLGLAEDHTNDEVNVVDPYFENSFEGFMQKKMKELEETEKAEEAKDHSKLHHEDRDLVVKHKKHPSVVVDEDSATMAVQVTHQGAKNSAIYGAKEALCLILPEVVAHALNQLPTFTDNLRIPVPTSARSITAGHCMRVPNFTEQSRLQENFKLPTEFQLQSDFVADFAISKQVTQVTVLFSNHVMELCEALHERSRHLFLGLAIGKGAFNFGGGRFKYNYASVTSKKERTNITNAIGHYIAGELAIHCLLLVPPLDSPGELDPPHPIYVPTTIRLVCFRRGPGTGESSGMKKNSALPSWMANSPDQQFSCVYNDLNAAMANGNICGRTKSELAGAIANTADAKLRLLFRKGRHEYVETLKEEIEDYIVKGDILEAYDSFVKVCSFNLEKQHEIYFEDPEDDENDAEYIPSLISSLPGVYRMSNSVAGRLRKLEGLARGLAVLCDHKNESNIGLPVSYVSIAPAVISRINGKVLVDQVEFFVKEIRRILTSEECLCLDGACRACLALIPKLFASVRATKVRLSTGGKLYEDGDESGILLADIMGLLEAVKLVDAKDVHFLQNDIQRHMQDLDDNDMI